MKMTFNRRLILQVLQEDGEDLPPHSAWHVHDTLKNAFKNEYWGGIYQDMKTVPNIQQVHRTLKDLWNEGLIVGSRHKEDGFNGSLPHWVIRYQLSADAYRNGLLAECKAVYHKVNKAKHGINFFGAVFDMGLPDHEVKQLLIQVKTLMQRTHPDKATGYAEQFQQMKQCRDWIKSGIPLPIPTFKVNESQTVNNALR
jgi:hypothetical protein